MIDLDELERLSNMCKENAAWCTEYFNKLTKAAPAMIAELRQLRAEKEKLRAAISQFNQNNEAVAKFLSGEW